jgi:UTP-glucose-1-phosphate uridylyltransferase
MAEIKNTPISKPVVEDAVAETVAEVVDEKVIVTPEPKKDVPTLGFNEDGVMGSTTTNAGKAKVEKIEVVESTTTKVALFSTRNVYADGFGKINVGYNIVPKKYVDFWTAQKGIRLCTPEEVAEAFA